MTLTMGKPSAHRTFFRCGVLILLCATFVLGKTNTQVVVVPVANMYSGPGEKNDVVSQAIYGSNVQLVVARGEWSRIETADHYKGWVPSRHIRTSDRQRICDLRASRSGAGSVRKHLQRAECHSTQARYHCSIRGSARNGIQDGDSLKSVRRQRARRWKVGFKSDWLEKRLHGYSRAMFRLMRSCCRFRNRSNWRNAF